MSLALLACAAIACQDSKPIQLFDGKSLAGWTEDVPARDSKTIEPSPFTVRDGNLVSLGQPMGHLITEANYENYRLRFEWRWPKEPGNSGVIVHVSKPRLLNNFLPQGIEVQLRSGNAGDFHLFGETLKQRGSTAENPGRRLVNFTDDSEKPAGQWNWMVVECRGAEIKVVVNGVLVNDGVEASVRKGRIALQSEGAEIEFRKIELTRM